MSAGEPSGAYEQSEKYANPPIQEGLIQFVFAKDAEWNIATPGVIWTALNERYPRDPEQQVQMNVPASFVPGVAAPPIAGSARYAFSDESKTRYVLASPSNLSAHAVGDYKDWSELRSRMHWASERLENRGLLPPIASVSVHYINRINLADVPVPIELGDYFRISYSTPLSTKGSVSGVALRTEGAVPDEPNTMVNLIFASAVPDFPAQESPTSSFVLDIEFTRSTTEPWTAEDALVTADRLKTLENAEFENVVTDKLKGLFR